MDGCTSSRELLRIPDVLAMPHRSLILILTLGVAVFMPSRTSAQRDTTGRIEGEVRDSVNRGPLVGAVVFARPLLDSSVSTLFHAETDSRGRFELQSLPAGRYELLVTHEWLETSGIAIKPVTVTVVSRERTSVKLGVPSPLTLRRSICGETFGDTLTGAIAGLVKSAESARPLAGANVVFEWTDIGVDPATRAISSQKLTGSTTTDSLGVFRGCGLPLAQAIVVQAQLGPTRNSGIIEVQIGPAGILLMTVLVSDSASTIASADSTAVGLPARDSSVAAVQDTVGGHVVTGRVLGDAGQPLTNAQVRLIGSTRSAATNDDGRFRLRGVPAGTQGLEFAALGFYPTRRRIDVRPGIEATVEVGLRRLAAVMDTIRVIAQRQHMARRFSEFEKRRARGNGHYLTEEQIQSRRAFYTTDLFRMVPGVRVVGSAHDARLTGSRGARACAVLYLDGMRLHDNDANVVTPGSLYGIEVYSSGFAPPQYFSGGCTVIVLWSK
jgi:hypothetical protein